jgi:serine/threonine protein kinase
MPLTDDEVALERFAREAELGRRLVGPEFVNVREEGTLEGRPYLMMDLLEGRDLRDGQADERLSFAARRTILARAAWALNVAHAFGVVHRDVKPANVFLERNGNVRIIDFGIAFADGDGRLTDPNIVPGSPRYMSPEQSQGEPPRPSMDIFSLGVMAYEVLSGHAPWGDDVSAHILPYVVAARPPRPFVDALAESNIALDGQTARHLESNLARAIAIDPAARHRTIAELGNALELPA